MKKIIYRITRRFVRSCEKDISYADLQKMIKENKKIVIIDVRTKDEFAEFHLNKAINIPLQDIVGNIINVVSDKNEIIVVYCQYGGRSRKAFNKLEKMGYCNVYNLEDGIEGI